jgi:hypothetical protein
MVFVVIYCFSSKETESEIPIILISFFQPYQYSVFNGITIFHALSKFLGFGPVPVAANKCVGTPSSISKNGRSKWF